MKVKFHGYPDTIMTGGEENGRPLWLLQAPFYVEIATNYVYAVPEGFIYDYASIPRIFWTLFNPTHHRYAGPSTLHDYWYAAELFPQKICDQVFLYGLKSTGVLRVNRNLMYAAVRAFGHTTWKKHTQESVMQNRELINIDKTERPLWKEGNIPWIN